MKKININKKENRSIIPRGIVLVNNNGQRFTLTEKSDTKKVLKRIIAGYNKIYSIKEGKGVEKNIKKIERIDDLLACKFQGEKNLHILKSSKLLEVSSLYTINFFNLPYYSFLIAFIKSFYFIILKSSISFIANSTL